MVNDGSQAELHSKETTSSKVWEWVDKSPTEKDLIYMKALSKAKIQLFVSTENSITMTSRFQQISERLLVRY